MRQVTLRDHLKKGNALYLPGFTVEIFLPCFALIIWLKWYEQISPPALTMCREPNIPKQLINIENTIESTFKDISQATRKQAATGKGFRLYVIGYTQFFNDQDPGCNTVTFSRTANPNPDNKEYPMMTTDLRQDFNLMSVTLNSAIKEAVHQNSGSNVKYIDIDVLLGAGHRFCEPGVKKPDLDNPKLWFWYYPYDSNEENEILTDPTIIYLNGI
ncbi:uncharacterized protein EAE97_007798 [Botrytis byssoidea]|uniref:Uncharacterized protein n=1 Tax=Botrytis byssoidea TaxID=139641 RepID=A0A9P5IIK6_9HELO|nr:uncharacterized protein EAE97_007798 [Botrytis byssoidea]KAF7938002.1 hypothetical protein EAE97_007798 [Botrytis byssoidea]